VPYLIVVGDKEVEQQQVAVRTRTGDDLGVMSITDFEEMLHAEVARRSRKQ
jgi:threonyl-tRNA synthetase